VTSKSFQDTGGNQTAECTAKQRTSIEQGHSQVQFFLGVPLREIEEDTDKRQFCSADGNDPEQLTQGRMALR
jgi:hypothetical protein